MSMPLNTPRMVLWLPNTLLPRKVAYPSSGKDHLLIYGSFAAKIGVMLASPAGRKNQTTKSASLMIIVLLPGQASYHHSARLTLFPGFLPCQEPDHHNSWIVISRDSTCT